MNLIRKYQGYAWILLLVPIYLFLFLKLGVTNIQLWDEGWYSVHAVEMWLNNSWFVTYFDGKPDVYASKPPLQTWSQIFFLNLFGIDEFAIRLPSAISASLTVLFSFFWLKKHTVVSNGLLAGLVLLTSMGFVHTHTARTGDADAMLTLTLFLQAVTFYKYWRTNDPKLLLLIGLLVGVSFWVKSMAAFLFIPALAFFALISSRKRVVEIFSRWQFYAGAAIPLIMALSYLFLRENLQPGYLDFFQYSNLGRYTEDVGHDQPFGYYFDNLINSRFVWWAPFYVLGFVLSMDKRKEWSGIPFYSSIVSLAFLLVLSFSRSKLVWYDMPFYPLAAITVAFGLFYLFRLIDHLWLRIIAVAFLLFIPSNEMFSHTQGTSGVSYQDKIEQAQERYLKKAFDEDKNLEGLKVLHNHYPSALIFYRHKYASKHMNITLTNKVNTIEIGDRVLVEQGNLFTELQQRFYLDTLDHRYHAAVITITSNK